ncbi:hypothetical protein ACHAWF_013139 [Thalassiosira exigua]
MASPLDPAPEGPVEGPADDFDGDDPASSPVRRSVEFAAIDELIAEGEEEEEEDNDDEDEGDDVDPRATLDSSIPSQTGSISLDDIDPHPSFGLNQRCDTARDPIRRDRSSGLELDDGHRLDRTRRSSEAERVAEASPPASDGSRLTSALRRFTLRPGTRSTVTTASGVARGRRSPRLTLRSNFGREGTAGEGAARPGGDGTGQGAQQAGAATGSSPRRRGAFVPPRGPERPRHATVIRRRGTDQSSAAGSLGGGGSGEHDDDERRGGSRCVGEERAQGLKRWLARPAWRVATLVLILVLLFGPPVQDIWLPKSADDAMDAIFSLSFLVLMVDIIVRSLVDPTYFSWNCGGGSFPHYFLSYVNPQRRTMRILSLVIDDRGYPKPTRPTNLLGLDWSMTLTVARVGLMARFIRTSVLVHITSSFPVAMRFFHPQYWWRRLRSWCRRRSQGNQAIISERVLANSSKVKGSPIDESHRSDISVSTLGDSQRHSGRSSRKFSASQLELQLESFPEETQSQALGQSTRRTSAKSLFGRFSLRGASTPHRTGAESGSTLFGGSNPKDSGSHVGAAMQHLTGQRIATGVLLALLITLICNWHESPDQTETKTMFTLHGQTANLRFAALSVNAARTSVIPTLLSYERAYTNGTIIFYEKYVPDVALNSLREREKLNINVIAEDYSSVFTEGLFDNREVTIDIAKVELATEVLILLVWAIGLAAFAAPIMTLIVSPIERMVRLLSMLVNDPLGYQNAPQYRKLKHEEEEMTTKSLWPRDVLKGAFKNEAYRKCDIWLVR